jgi:hypothetical protein
MSYRVRVSAHQLALMLEALEEDATLDIMLQPDQIAQVTDWLVQCAQVPLNMPYLQIKGGVELTTLLQDVLQEPDSEQVVHSLVI